MKKGRTLVLPHAQQSRLSTVIEAITDEDVSPAIFKGKRLRSDRRIISIPLGRRWRAIFLSTNKGYRFLKALSHERYNKINSNSSLV